MNEPRRLVAFALRCLGGLDCCAIVAVLAPANWLDAAHAGVGLGPFPDAPIAMYLIRAASALYVLHGALLVYVSYDVDRYWMLIRFLALASIFHGASLVAIDLSLELPFWWKLVEGPGFAAIGIGILALQRRAERGKKNAECRTPNVE